MLSKNFCVKESPDLGRYVTSIRNFELGEVVWQEAPLIAAPAERTDEADPGTMLKYTCVGCCRMITDENMRCHDCNWPCCSATCAQSDQHKNYECSIFERKQISVSSNIFKSIIFIRWAIYKKRKPKEYEQIMTLSDKFGELKSHIRDYIHTEVTTLWKFLAKVCELDATKREVSKWLKIHRVNNFKFRTGLNFNSEYTGTALYEMGCLFSHSCFPNLEFSFNSVTKDDGQIVCHMSFVARQPILSGDTLSISYGAPELRFGTVLRQLQVRERHKFVCRCHRCKDRTEEGTFMSAIACPHCKGGYLLPMDPLGERTCRWKCGSCKYRKRASWAKNVVLSVIKRPLNLFNMNSADRDSLIFADGFIEFHSGFSFHRNHYLITQCGIYWLLFSTFTPDLLGTPKSSLKLFIKIMRRLRRFLPLSEKFGLPSITARLNFVYAQVLATFLFKSKNLKSIDLVNSLPRDKVRVCNRIISKLQLSILWTDVNPNYSKPENEDSYINGLIAFWSNLRDVFIC